MTYFVIGEKEKSFEKGSSKPEIQESLESRIRNEILRKQKNRLNVKSIDKIELVNVIIETVNKCNNPNSNYYYEGSATVREYFPSEVSEKLDYQDKTACKISGYAKIEENNVELIDDVSIDFGLLKQRNLSL